jgi:hypothetical protein
MHLTSRIVVSPGKDRLQENQGDTVPHTEAPS